MCIVKPVAYVCIHIYPWYIVPNFAGHPQFAEAEDSIICYRVVLE